MKETRLCGRNLDISDIELEQVKTHGESKRQHNRADDVKNRHLNRLSRIN